MNGIKTYLRLALCIAFCASFQAFAMEKESEGIVNTSGEDMDAIGYTSSMSNESGTKELQELLEEERIENQRTRDQLAKQLLQLQYMDANAEKTLKNTTISIIDIQNLQRLRKDIYNVTRAALAMYNGKMLPDTQGIDEDIKTMKETFNTIAKGL